MDEEKRQPRRAVAAVGGMADIKGLCFNRLLKGTRLIDWLMATVRTTGFGRHGSGCEAKEDHRGNTRSRPQLLTGSRPTRS